MGLFRDCEIFANLCLKLDCPVDYIKWNYFLFIFLEFSDVILFTDANVCMFDKYIFLYNLKGREGQDIGKEEYLGWIHNTLFVSDCEERKRWIKYHGLYRKEKQYLFNNIFEANKEEYHTETVLQLKFIYYSRSFTMKIFESVKCLLT